MELGRWGHLRHAQCELPVEPVEVLTRQWAVDVWRCKFECQHVKGPREVRRGGSIDRERTPSSQGVREKRASKGRSRSKQDGRRRDRWRKKSGMEGEFHDSICGLLIKRRILSSYSVVQSLPLAVGFQGWVEGRQWERGGGIIQRQFENILEKETSQTLPMNKWEHERTYFRLHILTLLCLTVSCKAIRNKH